MTYVTVIRWIGLGVATAALSACATAEFSPLPPTGTSATAVQVRTYEPGSGDLPIGAEQVSHTPFAVIAGKSSTGGAGFGLLGALYAQHEGSSAGRRAIAGHESALHIDLARMTKQDLRSSPLNPQWARADTSPANRLEIRPYAILQSEDGVHAQVYVVLKTTLMRHGSTKWSTRYIAEAPSGVSLQGSHAWFRHDALRASVQLADREAVRILVHDLMDGRAHEGAQTATITGILPGVAKTLTVPALIRTQTARRIVFTPKLPSFSVLYGVLSLPADAVKVRTGS